MFAFGKCYSRKRKCSVSTTIYKKYLVKLKFSARTIIEWDESALECPVQKRTSNSPRRLTRETKRRVTIHVEIYISNIFIWSFLFAVCCTVHACSIMAVISTADPVKCSLRCFVILCALCLSVPLVRPLAAAAYWFRCYYCQHINQLYTIRGFYYVYSVFKAFLSCK